MLFLLLLPAVGGKSAPTEEAAGTEEIHEIINRIKLPDIGPALLKITDFGAIGDGVTDCRPAIHAAIREAASRGGGRVIFPEGHFFCKGPIHMKSKINLHLEEGCLVSFSDDSRDYLPLQLVRWEGVELYNYSPYIYAIDQTDLSITGRGRFDGEGAEFRKWRPKQKPAQTRARQMGHELVPVGERVFGEGHFIRFTFIQFMRCERILISGIQIEDVPFWVIQPTYCRNITIRDINVNSPHINNDGIDFDSSEDALVEDCTFICGDDAIVIKSGRDDDGWRVNKPSRNIVIRNCVAEEVLHGLAFGSEMSGGIEDIYIENFFMKKVKRYAIQFKSNRDRGAYIKNIWIDGVFIDTTMTAIYFTNDYHSYSGGQYPTEFHRIDIRNVVVNHAYGRAIDIQGLEVKPIHHVGLTNVTIWSEDQPSRVTHTEQSRFANLNIAGDEKSISDLAP